MSESSTTSAASIHGCVQPRASFLERSRRLSRSEDEMPERSTIRRARRDKRAGKSASTQAGEFVREEMDHIREGKHGARSAKQAIAIGLSKARRAGVELPAPKKGKVSESTRKNAARAYAVGHGSAPHRKSTRSRSGDSTRSRSRES